MSTAPEPSSSPEHARSAVLEAIARRWYACPFRWQILIAITLLTLATGLVGGILAVFDSRTRAAVETRSNIELWRHHIAAQAREIDGPADLVPLSWRLAQEMARIRHVTIRVLGPDGTPVSQALNDHARADAPDRDTAPEWFVRLVQPNKDAESVPIIVGDRHIGIVVIEGEPDDEIAEAWELLKLMAILWLGGTALMMVGLYFVLGYMLDPLVNVAEGMHELEDGHYGLRLETPKVRELEAIVTSFNTLAEALDRTNDENSLLYRQLVAVQEDERRQISRDLHDEFGPCLFGITAAAGSIERHAKGLPEPPSSAILSCVNEIALVAERLKSLNRSLLNRLRPVALGRVTLAELIGELILSFERRHPDKRFERHIGALPASFGEDIDLTIYRCVQESLTNAMRHGNPTAVSVALSLDDTPAEPVVRLGIADDGIGISETALPGHGLSGMRERVRARSGTLVIEPRAPAGTTLRVTLPVPVPESRKPETPALSGK